MIKSYRKLPVIIQAVQYDGENFLSEIRLLAQDDTKITELYGEPPKVLVHTLEGTMEANVGDFIVRGVKGELYPVKPEIFNATYEDAETPS